MKDNKTVNLNKEENKAKDKNIYYLKIKKYNQSPPIIIRRPLEYSSFGNYDKINGIIRNVILNLRKEKGIDNYIPILILNHPKINEISIYSKEQWDFYYKYNIIDECITNKSLKIDFILIKKNKKDDIISQCEKNKKNVAKYIIKNIPINIYLNLLLNFLEKSRKVSSIFQEYIMNQLINEDKYSFKNTKNTENTLETINEEDTINENLNINSIINPGENENKVIIEERKDIKNKKNNINEYIIDNSEFINALKDRTKKFNDYEYYLNDIKNVVKEEIEEKNKNIMEEKNISNSSLDLVAAKSFEKLIKDEDNCDNTKNYLSSVLNLPSQYVPNLLNKDNYFKKFDEGEYYIGIEQYKDEINREAMESIYTLNNSQ